ncbi:hypothetical protein [Halochromatium roseum]|uniref:hypothetical protein n=1 Tax=Halochromatium roseum TaxID=391920 RepID=UPI0019143715|nr:hypothetical protein [Halochromatium roseum]MBK5938245.1 hypothetical protein [Halochromatium roseum]
MSNRFDLLMAMVSRDPLVLAKLVRTLRPRRVLLCSTPHASASGWTQAAERMLIAFQHSHPDSLIGFQVIALDQPSLAQRIAQYRQALTDAGHGLLSQGARIALDCTTGQGLFHITGVEALKQLAAALRGEVFAAYCDADDGRVLLTDTVSPDQGVVEVPIELELTPGRELIERFSMYGVDPRDGEQLWQRQGLDASAHEAHCALYDALCHDRTLRLLFSSYMPQLRAWKQARPSAQAPSSPQSFSSWIKDQADAFARNAASKARNPAALPQIHSDFVALLRSVVTPYDDLPGWQAQWNRDPRLSVLRRSANEYAGQVLFKQLRQQQRSSPQITELNTWAMQQPKQFIDALCQVLMSASDPVEGSVFAAASSDEFKRFLRDMLATIDLQDSLKTLILKSERLSFLFERCIGHAVVRGLERHRLDSVAGVWQNVRLCREDRYLAEFDTLILFRDGRLTVLESKLHPESADHKKIEANIKTTRDFGGAYSDYLLVYPLTTADLNALQQASLATEQGRAPWIQRGMQDVHAWHQYLLRLSGARDQRLLGLDALEQVFGVSPSPA